ncbi:ATP-dependent zinc metalloprotease FtsH [Ruminococcaceae bacterium OttesenSCG-928-L11]|nr:ATP-dependent zinc metalloprotease FtsH [Ruminococcaceae bacterium OttesenSCG-928-L11]
MNALPKRSKGLGIYLAILLVLLLGLTMLYSLNTSPVATYKYTDIIGYFQKNQVREFTLHLGTGDLLITKMDNGETGPISYKVPNVNLFLRDIHDDVMDYNKANPGNQIVADYKKPQEFPLWVSVLPSLLLIVFMVVFWVMMMRQTRGSGGNVSGFGKAKARSAQDGRRVTFSDVEGADEEKEELIEVVEFLKSPGKFNALGARIPKGVLLVGPPGTGKTLLARAVAGEAEVQFFSISGSDFVEMFVGVGASRVRDLFDQAKKSAPSVVFIDEIDAVGRQRGAGLGGGHDEREQTLNQLLVEMDGFSANTGVIIMAATNRRDILDPALLRPGRFDRQIVVGYPDIKGREKILRLHCRNKPLGPDVDLLTIARTTAGFTGADLENLVNEAALLAARKNLKAITMIEIEEATIKVVAGPEKRSHVVTPRDKRITAYHEAGHAVATYYCETQDPVHQVSIIPRGMAAGYTLSLPSEDHNHVTKKNMYEDIIVLMGGRVAEQIILDDISTGASNDLERATKTARNMVTRYGFSDAVGPIVYGGDQNEVFLGRDYGHMRDYSEEIASEIDKEVRSLIESAYQKTTDILNEHVDQLHLVAQYVFENEKIDADEFIDLMTGKLTMDHDPFEELLKAEQEKKNTAPADKPTDGEETPTVFAPTETEQDAPEDPTLAD